MQELSHGLWGIMGSRLELTNEHPRRETMRSLNPPNLECAGLTRKGSSPPRHNKTYVVMHS